MMKVPIMMAYFKLAQIDPSVLNIEFTYLASPEMGNDVENIPPTHLLTVGKPYTTDELIRAMIVDSDNNAMHILATHIDQGVLDRTLVDLGIVIPTSNRQYNFVTAQSFANIFRNLYNASYLDRAFSQKALELLQQSSYKPLSKHLPPEVVVASKFGERIVRKTDGSLQTVQLHECGIVYAHDPYSICIMTEGSDLTTLASVIADTSKAIYTELK